MFSKRTKKIIVETAKTEALLGLSFLITLPLFYSTIFIHEGGHIFFGLVQNIILYHSSCTPWISNWDYNSGIPFPQQTHNCFERNTAIFIFGGMFGVIIVVYLAIRLLSRKMPQKSHIFLYLILLTFTLQQILDNYVFGSDNPTGKQMLDRTTYGLVFNNIDPATVFIITLLIFFIFSIKFKTSLTKIIKHKQIAK